MLEILINLIKCVHCCIKCCLINIALGKLYCEINLCLCGGVLLLCSNPEKLVKYTTMITTEHPVHLLLTKASLPLRLLRARLLRSALLLNLSGRCRRLSWRGDLNDAIKDLVNTLRCIL